MPRCIASRYARVPASINTTDKFKRIVDLLEILEAWVQDSGYWRRQRHDRDPNNLNVVNITEGRTWVPMNSFLRLEHIKALKYPLQPLPVSGLDGKLWVMRLGLPRNWKIYGLTPYDMLITGPPGHVDVCEGYDDPNWTIGGFARRGGGGPSEGSGSDLATLRGDVFIILNDDLLEHMEEFVANLTVVGLRGVVRYVLQQPSRAEIRARRLGCNSTAPPRIGLRNSGIHLHQQRTEHLETKLAMHEQTPSASLW
jgi:hypothetical protein